MTDTAHIWIVLIEDRHSDVDAYPFSTEELAAEYANSTAPDDAEPQLLTDGMRRSGWVLYLSYGAEGDCVRVIKRALDTPPRWSD